MNINSVRFRSIVALGAALSGCAVGPDYHRPAVPVPARYTEAPPGWTSAAPADALSKGDWWTDFHDPLIDQLEPLVAVSNQTVRQDYANYEQALAEVKVAISQLFPTVGLTGTANRSGGPGNAASNVVAATGGRASRVITAGSLEGTSSWTLDIWGQVRRMIEENKALAQADEATLVNATLSEQTLLATTIIELRFADATYDLQQQAVDAFRDALRVTEAQGLSGLTGTPPSAVIAARVALETAQATLIGLGVARAQFAHAIAVLVGKNPEDLDIPHSSSLPTLPTTLPFSVPSTLLQRRPDIAAAERTMKAQNAAVGVAVAAYYPTISLTGSAGFQQAPLAGLLHVTNHVWSIGASGTETLLDFGKRHAEVQAARAAYEAAVASYRGTVLNAFQNVENDLSGLRILGDESQALDVAVRDAIRGSEIALAEFKAGIVDYTTVAVALEAQFSDQQTQLSVQQNRVTDAVSLIGDLGGGWSDSQLHAPGHPKTLPAQPAAAGPLPPPP